MSRSLASFKPRYSLQYGNPNENGLTFSELDIRFVIDSGNAQSQNHNYRVDVYNLKKETTAHMIQQQKDNTAVFILEVGYEGDELLTTIATSTVSDVGAKKSGTELITSIYGTGGYQPLKEAKAFRNFSENTTGLDVFNYITQTLTAAGLQAKVDLNPEIRTQLENLTYANGYRIGGLSKDALTQLLVSNGLYYKIESGRLKIHKVGIDQSNDQALEIVINESSGLIDSPHLNTTHAEARERDPLPKDGIHFKTVLDPRLKVGVFVKVQSDFINGCYRLSRVMHRGATRGRQWVSECQAEVVNAS